MRLLPAALFGCVSHGAQTADGPLPPATEQIANFRAYKDAFIEHKLAQVDPVDQHRRTFLLTMQRAFDVAMDKVLAEAQAEGAETASQVVAAHIKETRGFLDGGALDPYDVFRG